MTSKLNPDLVSIEEQKDTNFTPDKVEEIVKTFGNELAMDLTPSNEAMNAVRFAREALRDILTQYHQDLMSEVLKDIDMPWLLKEQERGEFGHVTSELWRLVAKYEPLSNLSK